MARARQAAAAAAALMLLAVIAMGSEDPGQQDLSESSTNSVQHSSVQHLAAKFEAAHDKAHANVKELAAKFRAEHVDFSPVNGGSQYSAIRQGTAGIAPFFSSSVLLQPAVRRTGPLAIFFVFVRCT